MSRGIGSARRLVAAAATVVLCMLVLHAEMAQSAVYTVGGRGGWTFNVSGWPKGKRFRAGDTLVFNYSPSAHNVVAVNGAGYNRCRAPRGARTYSSGKDRIKLVKGRNFFICSFVGHCRAGMKIAVTAA